LNWLILRHLITKYFKRATRSTVLGQGTISGRVI